MSATNKMLLRKAVRGAPEAPKNRMYATFIGEGPMVTNHLFKKDAE